MRGPETTSVDLGEDEAGFPFTYHAFFHWAKTDDDEMGFYAGVTRRACKEARNWCTEQFGEAADVNGKWGDQVRRLGWEPSWFADGCLFYFRDHSQAIAFKLRWHGISEQRLHGV